MAKNPPRRSRYDDLHDKYHSILTTKAGTRYERLAAMVFKALEDRNVVIHDFELPGDDPEVKHQIDVTVETGGARKRVIIECKDFDISKEKVGLGILLDFRSVVEDTKADEAIVVSCIGFTEDAQKYARSKGIKLAILRLFETCDMDGRIAKIIVGITVQQPENPSVTVAVTETEHPRYLSELAAIGASGGIRNTDPVFFVRGKERHQFNFFLTQRMNEAIKPEGPKTMRITLPSDGWQIQVSQNLPIHFDGIIIDFDVDEEKLTVDVVSQRVAELILSGFGSSDLIIFGDQIERHAIDPVSGVVV